MAEYLIQDNTLTDIADAIREKTNTTDSIMPMDFAALIKSISSGSSNGLKLRETPLVAEGEIQFQEAENTQIIHNLGVIPDIIKISLNSSKICSTPYTVIMGVGFRSNLLNAQYFASYSDAKVQIVNSSAGIDTGTSTYLGFRNANSNSINFGGAFTSLDASSKYRWTAISLFE